MLFLTLSESSQLHYRRVDETNICNADLRLHKHNIRVSKLVLWTELNCVRIETLLSCPVITLRNNLFVELN